MDAEIEALAPDLARFLRERAIATTTHRHAAVFTVAESAALRGTIRGAHTKNLFVKDKRGALFLVVAEENRILDLKALHRQIGASGRVSFADAGTMGERLGVTPGSVTAFAALNDREGRVTVVLDAGLLSHDIVNAHPMTNTATTSIAARDLVEFLTATGHAPRVVDFDAGPQDGHAS